MPAQAGAAGGGGNYRARAYESFYKPLFHRLQIYFVGGGYDYRAHVLCNVFAFQNFGGYAQIGNPAVRAAAYNHLVNLYVAPLVGRLCVFGKVGEGYGGFERREVYFVLGLVFGFVVGHINFGTAFEPAVHIFQRERVYGENAVLCARLDCHIAHREPVVHSKVLHAVAEELHRFIQRAVHAYHSDNVQNQIFAAHVLCGLAAENELDGGGYLEPALARHHSRRHIGGADARGEGAQSAVSAGVAVCAYNQVARAHKSLFGQKGVLYAHRTHVKKIIYVLFGGKFAAQLALLRALYILVGRKVVHNKRNFALFGNLRRARLFKFLYGNGAGYVVGEHHIELGLNELPCLYFFKPRVRRKNFLRHCHCHMSSSLGVAVFCKVILVKYAFGDSRRAYVNFNLKTV